MCRKFTYEEVKEAFEARGYTLLSKEYINCDTKLGYECVGGHFGAMSFYRFKGGTRCPTCVRNKKLTYEEVKEAFELRGYVLLSDNYDNAQTKLRYRCPKGHIGYTTYGNFYQKHRCPICYHEERKFSYEEVNKSFTARGYTLLSSDYKNNSTKLNYRCRRNHLGAMPYSQFLRGHNCPECYAQDCYLTYTDVKEVFEARGYVLLSDTYINTNTKLKYKCPNGHIGAMSYGHFSQGSDCPICARNSHVSKSSQQWLDSLGLPKEMGINREVNLRVGGIRFKVDGFDSETNTVYEFLGSYWHGNPAVHRPDEINERSGKTFGKLYKETFERFDSIKQAGYNIKYVWEGDLGTVYSY